MKKTLIALAAMAVTSVSFAQVTVTGDLIMGYKQTRAPGMAALTAIPALGLGAQAATSGAEASGFGVDTSEIVFTAKEDLGGGQSIAAKMSLAGADRSGESGTGAVTGRDATLSYTNKSFGRIELGSERGAAIHSGIPSAGAPVIDMDGKIFQMRTTGDYISYAAPIGPVLAILKVSDTTNIGVGMSGVAGSKPGQVGQRTTDLAGLYTSGPLQVLGAYRSYDNRNADSIFTGDSLTKNNALVFQIGYDFGVAKLGFGLNAVTSTPGPKVNDMLLGVSVPFGALTLGFTVGREDVSGISDVAPTVFNPTGPAAPSVAVAAGTGALIKSRMQLADGSANSFSLGAKYDLSKRTNLSVKYASWTRSGYEQFEAFGAGAAAGTPAAVLGALGNFGYGENATETQILLSHSF